MPCPGRLARAALRVVAAGVFLYDASDRATHRRPVARCPPRGFLTGGSMTKLEFHDPSGTIEIKQPHAPRLASLEGKRIGIVTNEQWQAFRALPLLKSLFEHDVPGIEILPIDAFPQGNARIGSEETAKLVQQSGVDAVIIGNAA
jgi:hypothetical protein